MIKTRFITCIFSLLTIISFGQNTNIKNYSLKECIEHAQKNNTQLKAQSKAQDISIKNIEINKARLLPTIGISGNTQLTSLYDNLDEYSVSSARIEVSQSLWQNGKINTLIKIAKQDAQLSEIVFLIDKQNLAYQVSQQYFNVKRFSRLESIAKETEQHVLTNLESARERFDLGIAKMSDVLKAETQLSEANLAVNRYNTFKNIATESLIKSMSITPDITFQLADSLDTYHNVNISVDSLIRFAQQNLPELKLSELELQKQLLIINYEKRTNLPDLNLNTGYSLIDSPVINTNNYAYVGLSLNYKVFNGFEKKNRIAREEIRYDQIKLENQNLIEIIETEIKQAALTLFEAKLEIDNSLAQIKSASENQNMLREEYKMGMSSMLELLDAETDYYKAQQNYINALWAYQIAKLTIDRKTGKP